VSPRAYYNEIEPYAAQWLRNLIAAGHIAPGDVDERSIVEVQPADLAGYTQCHFFAGVGVWSHALRSAGWDDARPVWTGSCPCQPFSTALQKRKGTEDARHLWPHFFRLIRACQPVVCFGEQVASSDGLAWLDIVCSDLEAADYTVGAVDTCAAGFGAPHIRQRLYWVAHSGGAQRQGAGLSSRVHAEDGAAWLDSALVPTDKTDGHWRGPDWVSCLDGNRRPVEPGLEPLVDGVANRVGRLRAYGNAICAPQATAFVTAAAQVLGMDLSIGEA